MKKSTFYAVTIIMFFSISACGSGSSNNSDVDGSDNGSTSDAGDFLIKTLPDIDNTLSTYYIGGVFFEEENSASQSGLNIKASFFTRSQAPRMYEWERDQCIRSNSPAIGLYFTSSEFERITAGDQLIVSNPAGTYATLLPSDKSVGSYSDYFLDSLPVSKQFTMSIPGDEFPGISQLEIPDLTPLELLQPTHSDKLNPETVYRWIPDSDDNSHITISIYGNFSFLCHVDDDGEFSLPKELASTFDKNTIFDFGNITRFKTEFHTMESGVIQIEHNSSYSHA